MENNIIATISVLHVILGFTAGMAFASLIQVADRYKLYNAIEKAKDEKFNQDLRIDRLMDQVEYFENRTGELEDHVCRALNVLKSSLPPPLRNEEDRLDRQTQCEDGSDEFTLHSKMD